MAPTRTIGSRAQVWNGTAVKTSYGKDGLTKRQLMKNKWGRIVSVKKHNLGLKSHKYLVRSGYTIPKGSNQVVRVSGRSTRTPSRAPRKSRPSSRWW